MTRVELFEILRRDHLVHQKSIREIARERGVHRRLVRLAVADAVPPDRKVPERESTVLTPSICGLIDQWINEDREAPKKQRHTARAIYKRLVRDHDFQGAESTVRRHVGRRRRELGRTHQVFVPQSYRPGQELEVDAYEAHVDFPFGRTKVYFIAFRSCYSAREFHIAFPRLTQQAFLEAHVMAFRWFGAVFHTLRYDNLALAVKKVLKGRRRVQTDRFVAMRSHYLFDAVFCTPGLQGAHEKGGVEGGLGRFRRNHLVPVPVCKDFDELNRLLRDACAQDDLRRREGHKHTVLEDWQHEQPHLRALPARPFDTAEVCEVRVDTKARVVVRTNRYSVPVRLSGKRVEVRLAARRVQVLHAGVLVAEHERLQGRHGERLELDHYLELLTHKPGALPGALPLRQARDRGQWPADYDRLWQRLCTRFGEADGSRQLVEVLMLHRSQPAIEVHQAVAMALELGCCEAGAIAVLLRQLKTPEVTPPPLEALGALAEHGTPANTDLSPYDALLGGLVWS